MNCEIIAFLSYVSLSSSIIYLFIYLFTILFISYIKNLIITCFYDFVFYTKLNNGLTVYVFGNLGVTVFEKKDLYTSSLHHHLYKL